MGNEGWGWGLGYKQMGDGGWAKNIWEIGVGIKKKQMGDMGDRLKTDGRWGWDQNRWEMGVGLKSYRRWGLG